MPRAAATKVRTVVVSAVCLLTTAALEGMSPRSYAPAVVQSAAPSSMPDIRPSSVVAESISLDQQLSDGTRVHWTAQRVLRRKRRSALFRYENYAELAVSGLRVELHMPAAGAARAPRAPMTVLRAAIEDLRAGFDEPGPAQPTDAYTALALDGSGSEQLSRVLIEDLHIVEIAGDRPVFELHASSARFTAGDAALVLEGSVGIRSGSDHVDTHLAGWLADRSTLLVRDDHRFNGDEVMHSRLYALPENSIEPLAEDAPDIAFEDAFERLEQRLLAKVAGHASGPLALLLTGAVLR